MKKLLFSVAAAAAILGATSSALAEDSTDTISNDTAATTTIMGGVSSNNPVTITCDEKTTNCSEASVNDTSYKFSCDFSSSNTCGATFIGSNNQSYCDLSITSNVGSDGNTAYTAIILSKNLAGCEFKNYKGGATSSTEFDINITESPEATTAPASE